MSQPIIADTNMFAVTASGAWFVSQMMEMRKKLALFPEILETEEYIFDHGLCSKSLWGENEKPE